MEKKTMATACITFMTNQTESGNTTLTCSLERPKLANLHTSFNDAKKHHGNEDEAGRIYSMLMTASSSHRR